MSDHWNSLANLLGTPNLKPHSKKGAAEEVQPVAENLPIGESQFVVETKGVVPRQAKDSATGDGAKAKRMPRRGKKSDAAEGFAKEVVIEAEPVASVETGGVVEAADLLGFQDVLDRQESENPKMSSSDELTEKPVSVLRSSWDAVANFFGMGGISENTEQRSERPQAARRSSESPKGRRSGRSEDRDRGADLQEKLTEAPEGRSDQGVLASDGPVDRRGERRPPRRGASQRTERIDSENVPKEEVVNDIVKDEIRAKRTERGERGERPTRGRAVSERSSEREVRSPEHHDDRRPERADRRPERDDRRPERDDRRPERDDRRPERADRRPERDDRRPERDDRRPERADRRPERDDRRPERDDRRPERADRRPHREPRPVERGFGGGLDDFDVPSDESNIVEGFDKGVDSGRSERAEGRGESRRGRVSRREEDRDQQDRDQANEGDGRRRSELRNNSRSEARDSEDLGSFDSSSVEGDDREDARVRAGRIPSWEETVAVLIEANVANHRKTPSGPNRSRRGRPNS
jgi:hypothetical protein